MAEALKDIYRKDFLLKVSKHLTRAWPSFNHSLFLKQVFNSEWESLELKARMRHIAVAINVQLENDLEKIDGLLKNLLPELLAIQDNDWNFPWMFLPEILILHSKDLNKNKLKHLLKLNRELTRFCSCEFSIRPLLIENSEEVLKEMNQWKLSPYAMVRRLASEGSRPRLPWGLGVPILKTQVGITEAVIETLIADEHENVRLSASNHLNDISKDFPERAFELLQAWKERPEVRVNDLQHAARGLLKSGHEACLKLFGWEKPDFLSEIKLNLSLNEEDLVLELSLKNSAKSGKSLRLEYRISAVSRKKSKLFFWKSIQAKSGQVIQLQKTHLLARLQKQFSKNETLELSLNVNGQPIQLQGLKLLY